MYMFSKCYVGFCTPRHTIMDLKKKIKNKKEGASMCQRLG
jgi:hypothetical protein